MKFFPRSIAGVAVLVVALVVAASGGAVAAKKMTGDDILNSSLSHEGHQGRDAPADRLQRHCQVLAGRSRRSRRPQGRHRSDGPRLRRLRVARGDRDGPGRHRRHRRGGRLPRRQAGGRRQGLWTAHNDALQVSVRPTAATAGCRLVAPLPPRTTSSFSSPARPCLGRRRGVWVVRSGSDLTATRSARARRGRPTSRRPRRCRTPRGTRRGCARCWRGPRRAVGHGTVLPRSAEAALGAPAVGPVQEQPLPLLGVGAAALRDQVGPVADGQAAEVADVLADGQRAVHALVRELAVELVYCSSAPSTSLLERRLVVGRSTSR